MPVNNCSKNGKPGFKWGKEGTCYTYNQGNEKQKKNARQKAINQGIASGDIDAVKQVVEDLKKDLKDK